MGAKMSRLAEIYFETALWSSTCDNGEPMDDAYGFGDLSQDTIEKAEKDIASFIDKAGPLLDNYGYERILHDFWLTRNRHGAGFWDGYYKQSVGDKLTELSRGFGEVYLYIGDDGKIYC
jgi:hypothetical protein